MSATLNVKYKDDVLRVQVDEEDHDHLAQLHWYAIKTPDGRFYFTTTINGKQVRLHRYLAGLDKDSKLVVDHKNRDTLDNQKSNLRAVTKLKDLRNRGTWGKTPGSTFINQHGNHRARLNVGTYPTKEEAEQAIREARQILEQANFYRKYAGLTHVD